MAGPVSFTELFNFPEYQEAIDKISKANLEFGDTLRTIMGLLKSTYEASQGGLSKLSTDFEKIDEKSSSFVKSFSYVNAEVEANGIKINTLKKAYKDFSDSIVIADNSVTDLTSKAKNLKSRYESLDPAIASNKDEMTKLAKEYQDTINQIKTLEKELKGTTSNMKAAEGSYASMSSKLAEMKKRIREIPGAFDEMTGAINEADPEVKKLADDITKYDKALKAADSTMGNFQRNVGNYESATISLKQQLKQMNATLVQMKLNGEDNTQVYKEMIQKAGELKDTIADTNQEITNTGADRQNLQGVIGVFQGVAGAAAIAEGGMALFGVQNKEVAETIKRLVAIQAIMNGVNEIGQLLERQSAAMVMVTNAQKSIKVLVTRLETAAESEGIVVRKAAAAAQWLLNKAMTASPAFLLITIVAALAGVVFLLTRNNKDGAEAQALVNEKMQAYLDLINQRLSLDKKQSDIIIEQNQKQERSLQAQIDLKKAQKATDEEIVSLQTQFDEVKIKNANKLKDAIKKQNDEALFAFNAVLSNGKKVNNLEEARIQIIESIRKAQIKLNQIGVEKGTDSELYKEQKASIDVLATSYETVNGQIKLMADANKAVGDAYKANEIDNLNNIKLLRENYLKGRVQQIQIELQKSKEGSEAEYQEKVKLIERQKQLELFNAKTPTDKALINAKAERDTADLTADYKLKLAQSEVNAEISILNSKLTYVESGSNSELYIKKNLVDQQLKLDVISVTNSIKNISERDAKIEELNAKALKDKQDLERAKLKAELDNNNESIKNARDLAKIQAEIVLADPKSKRKDKKAATQTLNISNDLAINEQAQIDLNRKLFATEEDFQKAKDALVLEHETIRLNIIQQKADQEKAIKQGVFNLMAQGFTGILGLQKAASEENLNTVQSEGSRKLDYIEADRQLALKRAGDDKNAQIAVEEKYNEKKFKAEDNLNKAINKEKRKQAIIDRDIALFNIAINTAQAVMKMWAATGPAAIILEALPIAAGFMEAAFVMSKPLPKFKDGTMNAPEGAAVVNDGSGANYQELIYSKKYNKAYIPKGRNQVTYLNRGDVVFNAAQTQGILASSESQADINRIINQSLLLGSLSNSLAIGRKMEIEHTMINAMQSTRINEKAIGQEVGEQIKNMPVPISIVDERGFRRGLKTQNSTIIYLNERHSL